MAEGTFIVLALVICLALIAGLYFVIERLSDRVFTLAAQARAREQNDIINHERLARTFNELVDETTALTDALKNDRILRSHTDAARRVAAKKAARADEADAPEPDRRAKEVPPPAAVATNEAINPAEDEATCVLTRADLPSAARPAQPTPTRVPVALENAGGSS